MAAGTAVCVTKDSKLKLYCAVLVRRRWAAAMAAAYVHSLSSSGHGPQGPKPKPEWESFPVGRTHEVVHLCHLREGIEAALLSPRM